MTRVIPAGQWRSDAAVASVSLAFHDRHRRRLRMTDDAGETFLLDLPLPVVLAEGDGLALPGGGVIHVRAALEAVADITPPNPAEGLRLAWHVGNRHTPIQILPGGTFRILDDHVLLDLLARLGASIVRRKAAFAPESGVYASHGDDHAAPDAGS
ncbi:MAG: urease accessory protein UreE [Hyphomicrobium sp.]